MNPERINGQVEVWKHIVDVQQHFNDIEWRIRALAITALTFILGATFFGYLNAEPVEVCGFEFNPSGYIPLLGIMIWCLFWFADGAWYHRLLSGAGRAAAPVEERLAELGILTNLSGEIKNASHDKWFCMNMKSTIRLNIFYWMGILVLLLTLVLILLSSPVDIQK